MLNKIPYTYQKRGVFYFNRMVPIDLDDRYESRRINFSLRTKSVRAARQSASAVSLKLEGYWQHLRLQSILYTKTMLTVIAVALVPIAVGGFDVVGSAIASGDKVHKIAISNPNGSKCAGIIRDDGSLKVR